MKPYALALLALVACGGGGGTDIAPPDAPVLVVFGTLSDSRSGQCDWESGSPVTITIDPAFAQGGYEDAVLRHELWHALTRIATHSDDPNCISSTPAPDPLAMACHDERLQVVTSPYIPIRVSFPDDPDALVRAAAWWNNSIGFYVIEVVP